MKLSDLRSKGERIEIGGFSMVVRDPGVEFVLAIGEEVDAMRAKLALSPDQDLPGWADVTATMRARVRTFCVGWEGVEDEDGKAIPYRLSDGSINVDGGVKIVAIATVLQAIEDSVAQQRIAIEKLREEARKKLEGPLPVN